MARKRLSLFIYQHVLEEMRAGTSARAIEDKGLASRNTVRKIREKVELLGWLDPTNPMPTPESILALFPAPAMPIRESRLEPYREEVTQWAEAGHTPQQVFRKLKRAHPDLFTASIGSVKRFMKRICAKPPRGYVVLHFEPGEAAQVDFGSGPVMAHPESGKPTRTHIFVMTLCDSRHAYAEIVWDQKVETWLRCHRNAFEFFDGVPRKIIIDNLKSAIVKACFREPSVQRSYEEFARDYGFQVSPCRPRTPRHKGRVESGVKYVKNAFVPLREFRNLADANQQLLEWILGEAGNRIHGTTREVPLRAFAERERAALMALPQPRPETFVWAKAKLHDNCHVNFEKSYYSAPYHHVHETLEIRAGERVVEIHRNDSLIAVHARATRPGTFRTIDHHYPPEKVAHMMKGPQWCKERAQRVGPSCHEFVTKLLGDRILDRLAAAQGVLRFADKYGVKRLEAACARALDHDKVEYSAVKKILEKGLDQAPKLSDDSGQLHFKFLEPPRFARDIGRLLAVNGVAQ